MRVLPFLAKEQDVNFQNKLILDSCVDQPASSQLHLELSSFIRYLLSIYSALSAEIITVNKTTSAFGEHEFFMKKKKARGSPAGPATYPTKKHLPPQYSSRSFIWFLSYF